MFENPRRGRQARNFTTNNPKILDLKSSSEQIFSRKLPLGAPERCMLQKNLSTCHMIRNSIVKSLSNIKNKSNDFLSCKRTRHAVKHFLQLIYKPGITFPCYHLDRKVSLLECLTGPGGWQWMIVIKLLWLSSPGWALQPQGFSVWKWRYPLKIVW